MYRLGQKLLAALLVAALLVWATPLMAVPPTGMLHPRGEVSVNGKPAADSSAIFIGDKIETGRKAVGTIVSDGSTVLVAGSSAIVYGDNQIELACGTANVTTTHAMQAKVNQYTATPSDGGVAKFEATVANGKLWFHATQGGLKITDGQGTWTLAAGKILSRPAKNTCMPPEYPPQGNLGEVATGIGVDAGMAVLIICVAGMCKPVSSHHP